MFYFQIETSGNDTNSITDADKDRGIAAAERFCADNGIDAEALYLATAESDDAMNAWMEVESAAFATMFKGWARQPEGVCLGGFAA